jgi:hypothetical protein
MFGSARLPARQLLRDDGGGGLIVEFIFQSVGLTRTQLAIIGDFGTQEDECPNAMSGVGGRLRAGQPTTMIPWRVPRGHALGQADRSPDEGVAQP